MIPEQTNIKYNHDNQAIYSYVDKSFDKKYEHSSENTFADHAEGTIGNADVNANVLRMIQRMLNISSLRVLCDHRES
jgi:hypothetical protein